MSGFPVLDVVIGLAFLYLLFALSCTTLNEVIAGLFDKRAQMLRDAVEFGRNRRFRVFAHNGHAAIARFARRDVDGNLAEQGHTEPLRFPFASTAPENVVTLAVALGVLQSVKGIEGIYT